MGIEVDDGVVRQGKVTGGQAAVDELQNIVVIVDDKDGDALEFPQTVLGDTLSVEELLGVPVRIIYFSQR